MRISGRTPVLLLVLPILGCEAQAAQTCDVGKRPGAQSKWPNEPPGLTVVSDAPVGSWSADGWRCEGAGLSVDTGAVVFTFGQGFASGYAPGVAYLGLPAPTPETYFGFSWKPSEAWQTHPSGVNKIALLFPETSAGGTIYIMLYWNGATYTIQVETTFASDTRRLEPNLMATPVALGAWHQIEWYVRYSTTPTTRDGVVKWWLDGVPQGAYADLQMPADAGFIEYTIRPVWGGGVGDVKSQTDAFSYGRVRISRR